jgi:hypothetical protein
MNADNTNSLPVLAYPRLSAFICGSMFFVSDLLGVVE